MKELLFQSIKFSRGKSTIQDDLFSFSQARLRRLIFGSLNLYARQWFNLKFLMKYCLLFFPIGSLCIDVKSRRQQRTLEFLLTKGKGRRERGGTRKLFLNQERYF